MTQETKKHPHDAVIRAWLDGKAVQVRANGGDWVDIRDSVFDEEKSIPTFLRSLQYRIKPEDPDVYVSIAAYTTLHGPDMAPVAWRNGSNVGGVLPRLQMKLSEYLKIAQILD